MGLRVIFMGTPNFAAKALARLIESPHEVVAVYTQPPRPAGRGQDLRPSAVQELAEANAIPVHVPKSLKPPEAQNDFAAVCKETRADIAVVAAYGLILPAPVLAAPRLGCINIHGSLLPRWRGAAPIQRAILAGDAETGITIMQMDEGLDTGAILCREALAIGPATTCVELHDRLTVLGARMVVYALNGLEAGILKAEPQPADGMTYAAKLSREEGRLDWRVPARALERQVRAFSPWPGAWFELDDIRIKVLEAQVMGDIKGTVPGEVVDAKLTICCGDATLRLLQVQREGRQAQNAGDFLCGFDIPKGTRLALPEGEGPEGDGPESDGPESGPVS
ncbi:MAG: methionyl-tRNA formyltransferase [Alphaproteobacteria bacterium]|jgi:methionyl-tRNA formyltransferase